MKLTELKQKAYALAGVADTRELKRLYPALKCLDFRRKASWQQALDLLNQDFQAWLKEPPAAYTALFREIEAVSMQPDLDLKTELEAIATDLEELAQEYASQANHLEVLLEEGSEASSAEKRRQTRH